MIEYLIFDDEQMCLSVIEQTKEKYHNILLDFPVKFLDTKTDEKKYVFVVMEEYKEHLETYQEDLVESLPQELQPFET
jgi:hypothetical protein